MKKARLSRRPTLTQDRKEVEFERRPKVRAFALLADCDERRKRVSSLVEHRSRTLEHRGAQWRVETLVDNAHACRGGVENRVRVRVPVRVPVRVAAPRYNFADPERDRSQARTLERRVALRHPGWSAGGEFSADSRMAQSGLNLAAIRTMASSA